MRNPNEQFFTCIPGLSPEEHQAAFLALSRALHTIHTQNEGMPQMIDARSFFEYLKDMDAYERYFLPQVPMLATQHDDYLETFPEADSEEDDPGKNRWISPALALRFTRELRGEVPADLEAFLANFNTPGFFAWIHAKGDADGIPLKDALLSILENSSNLPKVQYRDMTARVMALLWEAEVNRLCAEHPGISEEVLALNEEDQKSGEGPIADGWKPHHFVFERALMEVHCWRTEGVSSADFVFPTFFGCDLNTIGKNAEGGQK